MSNNKKYDFSFNLSSLATYTDELGGELVRRAILEGETAKIIRVQPGVPSKTSGALGHREAIPSLHEDPRGKAALVLNNRVLENHKAAFLLLASDPSSLDGRRVPTHLRLGRPVANAATVSSTLSSRH